MMTYSALAARAEGFEQPKQEATEQHIWPAHWAAQQAQLIPVHAMEAIENMARALPRVAEKRGRGPLEFHAAPPPSAAHRGAAVAQHARKQARMR